MSQALLDKGKKLLGNPFVLACVGPVLLFFPILVSGRVLFWGLPTLQFVPWQHYALEFIRAGELPLWNPLNGLGAPFLANYQLAFFYPPQWISFVFGLVGGTPAMAWADGLLIMLHLCLAGYGMVLVAREIGLTTFAQSVSGIAFSMCGYLVARSGFFTMVWAVTWLPIIVYLSIKLRSQTGRFWNWNKLALTLAISAQLLAGHAQLAFYSLLLTFLCVVVLNWVSQGFQKAIRVTYNFTLCVLLAVLLTAIQLLPTLDFLGQSQRASAVEFDSGLTYSFWPWRLLTLFSPNLFGNPGLGIFDGYGNYWEDAAYPGLFVAFLALSTVVWLFRRKTRKKTGNIQGVNYQPIIVFLWAVVTVGFVFALGKNTPVFPFLYDNIPTFGMFNGPTRWMIWPEFGLCLLGGIAADQMIALTPSKRKRAKLMIAVSAAILIGAIQAYFILDTKMRDFIIGVMGFGIGGLVFLLLSVIREDKPGRELIWKSGFILFLFVDLIIASAGLIPSVNANYFQIEPESTSVVEKQFLLREEITYTPTREEYFLKFSRFFRFDTYNSLEKWEEVLINQLPNTNLLFGRKSANNFDPLVSERTSKWFSGVNSATGGEQARFFSHTGISVIQRVDPGTPTGVSVERINAMPRFRWYTCVITSNNEDEAYEKTVGLVRTNDNSRVVIEGWRGQETCEDRKVEDISIASESPNKVTILVNNFQDGWLVMADTWFPGWKVSIDGNPADIFPADYIFRGVRVPQGRHQVVFSYEPGSFQAGAVISGIAFASIVLSTLIQFLRKRHRSTL